MIQLNILQVAAFLCFLQLVMSTINSSPVYKENFCRGNNEIESIFEPRLVGYKIKIKKYLAAATEITVKLDSEGTIYFGGYNEQHPYNAKFTIEQDPINNVLAFVLLEEYDDFTFTVNDNPHPFQPPYIISLKINGDEQCENPDREYFNRYPLSVTKLWSPGSDKFCGRRRVKKEFPSLIFGDSGSKAGDWPWHTAIYSRERDNLKYECSGTLISKISVLTAAHCVSRNGVAVKPKTLGVILGKNSFNGTEITTQERKVDKINILDDFDPETMKNDIALLKLNEELIVTNYVQPVCIWTDKIYEHLQSSDVGGTVVGWGIDQPKNLRNKLHHATMTLVSKEMCTRQYPILYSNLLDGKSFCARYSHATAACNGDIGGGFFVFVADSVEDALDRKDVPGAWYLKGIIATSIHNDVNVCDSVAYTLCTDVAEYTEWILANMN